MKALFFTDREAREFAAAVKDDGGSVRHIRTRTRRAAHGYGHPIEKLWTVTFDPREDDETDQRTVG